MNRFGRVSCCGAIASYNDNTPAKGINKTIKYPEQGNPQFCRDIFSYNISASCNTARTRIQRFCYLYMEK